MEDHIQGQVRVSHPMHCFYPVLMKMTSYE
jgi:hypothetical protein